MRRSLVIRVLVCAALVCSLVVVAPPVAGAGSISFRWLNPLPHGEDFFEVDMVDANIGYAVSSFGKIMKTYDGGANWVEKSTGHQDTMRTICMIDSDTGWAGGDYGRLMKTDGTGGATWYTQHTFDGMGSVTDVFFLDANNGWVVTDSGYIGSTTDGGGTWVGTDYGSYYWEAICFTSPTNGFAVSREGYLWRWTLDSGDMTYKWMVQEYWATWLVDIYFTDADHGWIATDNGYVWRTVNGSTGANWTPLDSTADGNQVTGIAFKDANTGWMTRSTSPYLVKTINAGTTWTAQTDNLGYTQLYDVDCVGDHAIAVGSSGAVAYTSDGATWTGRPNQFDWKNLNDIQFLDLRTGYSITEDDVYKTTSAGVRWTKLNVPYLYYLSSLYFVDANTGWVVGSSGLIYKTADGGAHWTRQAEGVTTAALNAVYFTNASKGWAVGVGGTILSTIDGGDHWTAATYGSNAFYDIDFYGSQEGACVGGGGAIYVTANGGSSWAPAAGSLGTDFLGSVDYAGPNTIYAGGPLSTSAPGIAKFTLAKSTDGGATWAAVPAAPADLDTFTGHGDVRDVQFTDAQNGWVTLDWYSLGTIARTTDGGATWTYASASAYSFTSLCAVGGNAVWLAGGGGRLMTNYTPVLKTVWRFYNKKTGTHLYTADPTEKESIKANLSSIYDYEGVCYVYDEYKAEATLVRFYKPSTNTHFYSADAEEINRLRTTMANVYTYEGPVYNVSYLGGQPVWRFYIPRTGTHFYTADPAERDNVKNNLSATYQYEGPAYLLPQF